MPIINGKKFACDSCIRGHRVSHCNHYDRDMRSVARKGRPQKHCEHCRTARKIKSQHNKCSCGEKNDGIEMVKVKLEDTTEFACNCNHGDECNCGRKHSPMEDRLERSLKRATFPVMSKAASAVDSRDRPSGFISSGHHGPSHRFNNMAHIAGHPYPQPKSLARPHSLHGTSAFQTSLNDFDFSAPTRSKDDIDLGQSIRNLNELSVLEDIPDDELESSENGFLGRLPDPFDFAGSLPRIEFDAVSATPQLPALAISPNFTPEDYDQPNSTSLPLGSSLDEYTQSRYNSGDSTHLSDSELASGSSPTHSDHEQFLRPKWTDTIQLRDTSATFDDWGAASLPTLDVAGYNELPSYTTRHKASSDRTDVTSEYIKLSGYSRLIDGSTSPPQALIIPRRLEADDECDAEDEDDDDAQELFYIGGIGSEPPHSNELSRQLSWLQ